MSRHNDSMIYPKIEDLLERVDSKFSLVTLGAYRARQINSYFNQLGEGLGHTIPPQVSSTARKPLSISFEEIAADKIVKIARPDYEAMEAEAAEIFGEMDGGFEADATLADDTAEELMEAEEVTDVATESDDSQEVSAVHETEESAPETE